MSDYANDRADKHVKMMQEQRASKQRPDVISVTCDIPKNTYTVKENDNEIN